jgi:hypothetical protein
MGVINSATMIAAVEISVLLTSACIYAAICQLISIDRLSGSGSWMPAKNSVE